MHFTEYHSETNDCIQQQNHTKLSRVLGSVHFACSDPCAELGEVDVWNSFLVNNTCFIALNRLPRCVCKLAL